MDQKDRENLKAVWIRATEALFQASIDLENNSYGPGCLPTDLTDRVLSAALVFARIKAQVDAVEGGL